MDVEVTSTTICKSGYYWVDVCTVQWWILLNSRNKEKDKKEERKKERVKESKQERKKESKKENGPIHDHKARNAVFGDFSELLTNERTDGHPIIDMWGRI